MISAVATLLALVAIFYLMLHDFRSDKSKRDNDTPGTGYATLTAFSVGAVALLAVVTIYGGGAVSGKVGTPVALAVGVAAALSTLAMSLKTIVDWFFGIIGAVAAIPAVIALFRGDVCSAASVSRAQMIGMAVALVLTFAVVYIFTIILGKMGDLRWVLSEFPLVGLQLFGAVELVLFLNTPMGVSLVGESRLGVLVAFGLTVAFATLAASRLAPIMFGIVAVALFASSLLGDAAGAECSSSGGLHWGIGVNLALIYIAGFVCMFLLIRLFGRGGSRTSS